MSERLSVRVPPQLREDLEALAAREGTSTAAVVKRMLSEGTAMARVPGVVFADGPAGRRAVIAGTGIDVWEVVRTFRRECDGSVARLERTYDMLSPTQIRVALAYADLHPAEIDRWLARADQIDQRDFSKRYPHLAPR